MSKVDDALEWADQVADNAPGATREAILAAEVRRLRAMLEPTPDARELAKEIVDYVSEEEYGAIAFAEKFIAAHDAAIRAECAERAVEYLYKSNLIEYRDERRSREIRAAIMGEP